jgi:pimeloyl-ACP methyl ester carboxylesterase
MNEERGKNGRLHNSHTDTFTESKYSYSLLDPNPSLIDIDGNLINNIDLAASLSTYRNGTIADGVSKLILIVESNNSLQFSINDTKDGMLSLLKQASEGNDNASLTVKDSSHNISNGKSVVAAVYTPPDSFNQDMGSNRIIKINVSDPNNNSTNPSANIPIQLFRPPVVLVHGLWMNSDNTWIKTNFANSLASYDFYYAFADYEKHHSETFDPCDKEFGNYGIDSIRNTIRKTLQDYHHFLIAASQVDIISHSMGGLMARGFVQQPDYKGKGNYMKGSIHRLITIGTPHLGGPLSRYLQEHIDDWYFFDGIKPNRCPTGKVEPNKLRAIYSDILKFPIDKGAIEALIPKSIAYSHLHKTNVKSYAIAGSYKDGAIKSHDSQELYYKAIVDSDVFNLDKDAFDDSDNDLLVSIISQLGGLPEHHRELGSNDIPNHSAIYCNTVHAELFIKDYDGVFSETNSPHIQKDVIRLLSSDSNKFANAIGIDSSDDSSK